MNSVQGMTFEKPEKVPFRLTHNMVDALGVTGIEGSFLSRALKYLNYCLTSGIEGVFRRSCETTMRILRHNRESLMSVMETFIHDPLVEWTKKAKVRHIRPCTASWSETNPLFLLGSLIVESLER